MDFPLFFIKNRVKIVRLFLQRMILSVKYVTPNVSLGIAFKPSTMSIISKYIKGNSTVANLATIC